MSLLRRVEEKDKQLRAQNQQLQEQLQRQDEPDGAAACEACVSWQRSPSAQDARCCIRCKREGGEEFDPGVRRGSDPSASSSSSSSLAVMFGRILTADEREELMDILQQEDQEGQDDEEVGRGQVDWTCCCGELLFRIISIPPFLEQLYFEQHFLLY